MQLLETKITSFKRTEHKDYDEIRVSISEFNGYIMSGKKCIFYYYKKDKKYYTFNDTEQKYLKYVVKYVRKQKLKRIYGKYR